MGSTCWSRLLAGHVALWREEPPQARRHGAAGRTRIENKYSIAAMLASYLALYDELCKTKTSFQEVTEPCAE